MTLKPSRKALTAAVLTLCLLAPWPALPGGRDVPDQKSSGSPSTPPPAPEADALPGHCRPVSSSIGRDVLAWGLVWLPGGGVILRPAALRQVAGLVHTVIGVPRDGSCPS